MFSGSCWEETCVDHSSHSFEGRNQLNQWSQLFVVFSPSLSVCSNCTVISTSHWPRLIITPEQQQQHWLKNSCSHFSATDCTSPSMLSSSVKRHILVQVWRRKDPQKGSMGWGPAQTGEGSWETELGFCLLGNSYSSQGYFEGVIQILLERNSGHCI